MTTDTEAATEIVIRRAEAIADQLEEASARGSERCPDHPLLTEGVAILLRLKIGTLRNPQTAMPWGKISAASGTIAAVIYGVITAIRSLAP